MKIAIPTTNGRLSAHFGHCEHFAIIDVDIEQKSVQSHESLTPPPHEPGRLPKWLAELHVELIIAGGIGRRAQQLFRQHNIDLVIGAPDNTARELIEKYLTGQLQCGENICDH